MSYIREQHSSESSCIFSTSVCDIGCACFHYQESISDFYWYYSGKDVMDEAGQLNFSKALAVAKQIFNSLTEYIQVMHILYTSAPVHVRFQWMSAFHNTVFPLFRALVSGISRVWHTAGCGMQWLGSCMFSQTCK